MAELTATKVGPRATVGPYFQQSYRVTLGNSDDEWIVTEFTRDMAVVGVAGLGTSGGSHAVRLHRQGTGNSEPEQQGALGLRTSSATESIVTVRGR